MPEPYIVGRMSEPKLIMLSGFAGIGKSTIAERYINEHPLAMNLEGDRLIVALGQWAQHEEQARELVLKLSKAMAATHLASGHDVIVPYLPTKPEHLGEFEDVAKEVGARFIEIALTSDREETIQRLMKRGTWGEEGTDPITDADLPIIEDLYDKMDASLEIRPGTIQIPSVENDYDGTYQRFLRAIEQ